MSKINYIVTRLGAKIRGTDIYPTYKQIAMVIKRYYPKEINVNNEGM